MIALLAALLSAAPSSGTLAVLELRNKLQGSERAAIDAGYLTDLVRTAVVHQAPGLKVMTRENILVLLEAQGKKLEECEGECEVDTARRLGADYVISGEVLRFGSGLKLALRLHETGTGRLLAGAQASGASADQLEGQVRNAVAELLGTQPEQALSRREKAQRLDMAPWRARGALRILLDAGIGGAANFMSGTSAFGGVGRARIGLVWLRTPADATGSFWGIELAAGGSLAQVQRTVGAGARVLFVPGYAGVLRSFGSFTAGDEYGGVLAGIGFTAGYMQVNDQTAGASATSGFTGPGAELHVDFATLHPDDVLSAHFRIAATAFLGGTGSELAAGKTEAVALTVGIVTM